MRIHPAVNDPVTFTFIFNAFSQPIWLLWEILEDCVGHLTRSALLCLGMGSALCVEDSLERDDSMKGYRCVASCMTSIVKEDNRNILYFIFYSNHVHNCE
ncbi:hypothetical protein AVEN_60007-1 [Araneus ventricosus]|uniref:Uncharacterized protein n=1 Tax=Araneus ventricosus TaxID=182803 RepID=A0A4Y2CAU5_ARAVE|nr:hypothetical protein AVEN_60007-1 [Araneus ventricosus]